MPLSKRRYKKKGKKPNKNIGVISKTGDYSDYPIIPEAGSALLVQIDNSRVTDEDSLKRLADAYKISDKSTFISEMGKSNSEVRSIMNKTLEKATLDGIARRERVLKDYYTELNKIYGKSKEDLLSMNILDIRNLYKMMRGNPDFYGEDKYNKFIESHGWFYTAIPCFMSGVMQYRDDSYIEWRIVEIQEEKKQITLHIQHYQERDGFWEPGVSTSVIVTPMYLDDEEDYADHVEFIDTMDYSDIYRIIPISEFSWDDHEKAVFKKTVLTHADNCAESLRNRETSAAQVLVTDFIRSTRLFNFVLSVKKSKSKNKKKKDSETQIEWKDDLNPKRRIHYIGILPVKSEKPPRPVTRENISRSMVKDVRYKVPKWECRGFYRHMKNGRVVYVSPHVKHRRGYTENALKINTPVQTLIVRDPGKTHEEDNKTT